MKHNNDNTDPLDGADIGETRTVRESVELYSIDFQPDVFRGSDRMGRPEIAETEVITDELGDQKLVVTFEGDMVKRLPQRWDYHREPVTESEKATHRRRKWARKALRVAGVVGPVLLTLFIANQVMVRVSSVTMAGAEVSPPGIGTYAVLGGMMIALMWAIQYLPGHIGGWRV